MPNSQTNQWLSLLTNIKLSSTQAEVVKRFAQDPHGRSFLPMADVLKNHSFHDEAIELLMQGVSQHPQLNVARVVLARELLNKGLVADALQTLDRATSPLNENVLAQKLLLRLSILLKDDERTRKVFAHLSSYNMQDEEVKTLKTVFDSGGISGAHAFLYDEYIRRGVHPVLVQNDPDAREASYREGESSDFTPSADVGKRADGFHVTDLNDVFKAGVGSYSYEPGKIGKELDSMTLAGLYEKQNHYRKALEIYRRLLKESPSNEFLIKKISLLAKKEKEQTLDDLVEDPEVVDNMEKLEIVDRQIAFVNSLLEGL